MAMLTQLSRCQSPAARGCLGLGLVALDEEGAIDLDRIHGAGEPMEHETLGVRVGARLREREERGNHLGLR